MIRYISAEVLFPFWEDSKGVGIHYYGMDLMVRQLLHTIEAVQNVRLL